MGAGNRCSGGCVSRILSGKRPRHRVLFPLGLTHLFASRNLPDPQECFNRLRLDCGAPRQLAFEADNHFSRKAVESIRRG